MSDARLRDLERAARAGDPRAWLDLVWAYVRAGQPFTAEVALVATAMANQLSRGKQNLAEQTELDEALLTSGYFQLHYPTARLERALIRHFGSMKAVVDWARERGLVSQYSWPRSGPDHRYLRQIVLSAVQLEALGIPVTGGVGHALDDTRVGTPFYSGHAFFWHNEYRHYMRDQPDVIRKKVHDALMKAGLDLSGRSRRHGEVISRFVRVDDPEDAAWLMGGDDA